MKYITTKFNSIAEDKYFRNDAKFHTFISDTHWNLFCEQSNETIRLKDILTLDQNNFIFEDDKDYKGIPTGSSYIDEDGDIMDFQTITKEDHPNRLKYSINKNNILISSLRLAKAPALNFDFDDIENYVFSNGFYCFSIKNGWDIKFVYYLLRNKTIKGILDNSIYRGIGISSYKYEDLLKVKIKNISLTKQENAVKVILPHEYKIKDLKSRLLPVKSIIDKIFKDEFNFDYDKFESLKSVKIFSSSLTDFANNPDVRMSAKFHRQAGDFAMQELSNITTKKIKHYLSEPIVLGASISPSNYSDNGDVHYLSMATIKNWEFCQQDAQTVFSQYADDKKSKTVQKNDIILARSGEGTIGKVALIEDEDLQAVFADFTMRIRLKNYNHKFAYYYFRSTYFQYLIEVYKKGLGNNTNIFPVVIKEFAIPDIDISEQDRILLKIQQEIDNQNAIKSEIAQLRAQIDKIIEKVISM